MVLETNMLPLTPCSQCADSEPAPTFANNVEPQQSLCHCGAEGGNRTHVAAGTSGFTGRRNSILPPQHNRDLCDIQLSNTKKGANPF